MELPHREASHDNPQYWDLVQKLEKNNWFNFCFFMYRVFIKYCVSFQEFWKVYYQSLASTRLLLLVQKINQPIGVTVRRISLRALEVSHRDVGEGGVAVNFEETKTSWTPCISSIFPPPSLCLFLVLIQLILDSVLPCLAQRQVVP